MISEEIDMLKSIAIKQTKQIMDLFLQLQNLRQQFQSIKEQSLSDGNIFCYEKCFSKVILFHILINLSFKQITSMRTISRQFNELIIICLPTIRNQFLYELRKQKKENISVMNDLGGYYSQLQEVDFLKMKSNLQKKIQFEYHDIVQGENLLCINILFELCEMDKPDWRKAKYTFQMKINSIINKIDYLSEKYFQLNGKEIHLIANRFFFIEPQTQIHLRYKEIIKYAHNLKYLTTVNNYEQLKLHYPLYAKVHRFEKQICIITKLMEKLTPNM